MYTKTIYVIIDSLAILDILFTLRAMRNMKQTYARRLIVAMVVSVIAILSNIAIALSFSPLFAQIAYCTYFAAIDWIIYFLCGFCMHYTEHQEIVKKVAVPAAVIMGLDSLSLFANPLFSHHFYVYENTRTPGTVFYQTGFHSMYYLHLAIDYVAIAVALAFIIYRIVNCYSFYRIKYMIILSVLLLVIVLNVIYMMFALVLDASVVFYAVAGTLIYFCISVFVPRSLMNASIGRAVDDMNEGLILFDISNNCIYSNTFSKAHFDIEKDTCDLSCEPIASTLKTLARNKEEFGEAAYVKKSGGKTNHYRVRYNRLTDSKNRTIGSYFLIEDETEEVFYLNELSEARNLADQANEAKSSFLASMSHEIRTPLNSVLGMNEMILRTTEDPQLLEYAESIRLSGETLLSLINDILDFSKIEANKMDLVLTEYDPHKLLRDIYYFFEQAAFSKDIYLHVNCDENMPRRLIGDENRIRQILSNIVSNAVKYTASGGVDISLSTRASNNTSVTLILTVKDTGIGIAKEDLQYLFDAFRRVNEEHTANIQGTGLGLAITKELVDLMQGSVSVDSTPGSGSTFRILLPQKIADAAPIGPFVTQLNTDHAGTYQKQFSAPDAKILVVDDVPLNLKLICALLKKTGIMVDVADGGLAAIELCKKSKYDVILLDHRMPDPDGIATFEKIKEGMNQNTPVIMLTANALAGAEETYLNMGFAAYLSKPVRGNDLEKTLLRFLPPEKVETARSDR